VSAVPITTLLACALVGGRGPRHEGTPSQPSQ
jgi:hypothetical protein